MTTWWGRGSLVLLKALFLVVDNPLRGRVLEESNADGGEGATRDYSRLNEVVHEEPDSSNIENHVSAEPKPMQTEDSEEISKSADNIGEKQLDSPKTNLLDTKTETEAEKEKEKEPEPSVQQPEAVTVQASAAALEAHAPKDTDIPEAIVEDPSVAATSAPALKPKPKKMKAKYTAVRTSASLKRNSKKE